jgi:DNA-binding transcriptional MerR regulator/methylmalonyl-CoA mutase cobalamin-binding subunit
MAGNPNEDRSDTGKDRARFKINAVSELTGVSQDVLRIWERRYGAVTPVRTSGGTRLYSDTDIWRFTLLRRGVAKGYSIGRIVKLSNEELEKLQRKAPVAPDVSDPHAASVGKFINCIAEMKFEDAYAVLAKAVDTFPPRELIEKVFGPILTEIGTYWQHGEFGVAEEHLASNVLRAVLISIDGVKQSSNADHSIVLATPAGERHELGLMLAAISAALKNWRVVYLGLETPAEEIARTVRLTASDIVGLSVMGPHNDLTHGELTKLDLFLPAETVVIIGGGGARHYQELLTSFGWSTASGFDALETLPGT